MRSHLKPLPHEKVVEIRRKWRLSGRPKPCTHLGEPITPQAASDLGLNPVRNWRPCAKGHGIKGHVCQCKPGATCRGCPDYSAATVDEEAATRR